MEHTEDGRPFPKYISKMPETDLDIWTWLTMLDEPPVMAYIEKVGGFIQGADRSDTEPGEKANGGGRANGSAMFKFGMNFGAVKMALIAANIPFTEVTPSTWQRVMGIPSKSKSESKPEFKRRIKKRAQELFRGNITLHTADALLIAEYGRRRSEGLL